LIWQNATHPETAKQLHSAKFPALQNVL